MEKYKNNGLLAYALFTRIASNANEPKYEMRKLVANNAVKQAYNDISRRTDNKLIVKIKSGNVSRSKFAPKLYLNATAKDYNITGLKLANDNKKSVFYGEPNKNIFCGRNNAMQNPFYNFRNSGFIIIFHFQKEPICFPYEISDEELLQTYFNENVKQTIGNTNIPIPTAFEIIQIRNARNEIGKFAFECSTGKYDDRLKQIRAYIIRLLCLK